MPFKDQKDNILNEALKIFGRFGFTKTTMNDIANAAKKGRRTIYTYFKSKEEIFEAVIEREVDKIVETLKAIVESTENPPKKLADYFFRRMKFIYELANFNESLRKDFLGDYQRVEEIRTNLDQQELKLIETILREGIESKDFHFKDASVMAESLFYAIKGFEVKSIKQNFDEQCQEQLKEFIDVLFNGLHHTK